MRFFFQTIFFCCFQRVRIVDRSNSMTMSVWNKMNLIWFFTQTCIVDLLKNYVSPVLGVIYAMIVLEAHTLCRAAWYTIYKYRQDPTTYGFNTIHSDRRPVLLLHGAVGSRSYRGDLVTALRSAQIPVFVLNHGFGIPTDKIRRLTNNRSPIDLIAHLN